MSLQACFRDVDRFFKQFQSKISNPKVHIRSFEVWIQKPQELEQCLQIFQGYEIGTAWCALQLYDFGMIFLSAWQQALVQQVHCLTRFAQLQRCHPKKIKCIRIGLQVPLENHWNPLSPLTELQCLNVI